MNICILFNNYQFRGSPHGVEANVLDWDIEVRVFEIQLRYYVHFQTNSFEKAMNSLIPSAKS